MKEVAKKTKTGKNLRNYEICKGIMRFSKSKIFHRRRLFDPIVENSVTLAIKKAKKEKEAKVRPVKTMTKPIGGDKNGEQRVILKKKMPKTIPIEQKCSFKKQRLSKKDRNRARKYKPLRPSLIPGKILIVMAGPYRGKRVIFLDRLPHSGLLLITGPHKLNGCPLRRIHESRVIATTERIPGFELPQILDGLTDQLIKGEMTYFSPEVKKRDERKSKRKNKDEDIFESGAKNVKEALPDQKKEIQKIVDNRILELIDGAITENGLENRFMKKYLTLPFSLSPGQYPHAMVF
ncbi:unnamed protein product [Gordionus sp. m RMFG-2023]|uniref:large ribosomal subunit protein eL6-like n=1 Tax=Gordionus sp. m RMFG-2023 TaxID=3053472 RepID=UPI0030E2385A